MNTELKEQVDLMVNNYHVLKNHFRWESPLVKHFGAMVHATKKREIDVDRLEETIQYIKEETSWLSYFRGTNRFIIATLLCLEEDYKAFFKDMLDLYEKMNTAGFKRSEYLPLASYTIVKGFKRDQWDFRIKRMREFYDNMKANHFWLTSVDDYVFAAVLATTDLSVAETSAKIEQCYNYLNSEGFYKGNDLQSLSHILVLGEETVEEKCNKAITLHYKLKNQNCKLQHNGLATLGVLALITPDTDNIVYAIKEVYDYIHEQNGYGSWSLNAAMRTILAATVVSDFFIDEIQKGVLQIALGNSINSILIAQQQAAIAGACAASAAATASSSS